MPADAVVTPGIDLGIRNRGRKEHLSNVFDNREQYIETRSKQAEAEKKKQKQTELALNEQQVTVFKYYFAKKIIWLAMPFLAHTCTFFASQVFWHQSQFSLLYAGSSTLVYSLLLLISTFIAVFTHFLSLHDARPLPLSWMAEWNPLRRVQGGYLALLLKFCSFGLSVIHCAFVCSSFSRQGDESQIGKAAIIVLLLLMHYSLIRYNFSNSALWGAQIALLVIALKVTLLKNVCLIAALQAIPARIN